MLALPPVPIAEPPKAPSRPVDMNRLAALSQPKKVEEEPENVQIVVYKKKPTLKQQPVNNQAKKKKNTKKDKK